MKKPARKLRNGPGKGSTIFVEPIRSLKHIRRIKEILKNNLRDLAIFILGINAGLRPSELIRMTVGQVRHLRCGGKIKVHKIRTGGQRVVYLNDECIQAIQKWLEVHPTLQDDDALFMGQRGPLVLKTISNKVKQWCREIGIKGNYGGLSLRKTWGYHQLKTFRDPLALPAVMLAFRHNNVEKTFKYLGISFDINEASHVYLNSL